ncbi:MAG: 50S ribosomal protein L9 [Alphaproteobacteria bacterium]|nr:50S ribosomal protein L9 [Alphaproteobacteria bacterium]
MEVILLERIEKLGQMGDVVNVKPGFARNYLLPQSKALRATPENRENFESRRAELEAANADRRSAAEKAAVNIEGTSVVLVRQASDAGQLYGSVRPRDIANALNEQGAEIERTQVKLDSPIKAIGLHTVRIAVHPEVVVEVTANVARSEDEAALQAQGKSLVDEELEESEEADVGYEEMIADEAEDAETAEEAAGATDETAEKQEKPEDSPQAS